VCETVVILAPHGSGNQKIQRCDLTPPG
jgi:hypothetical protein